MLNLTPRPRFGIRTYRAAAALMPALTSAALLGLGVGVAPARAQTQTSPQGQGTWTPSPNMVTGRYSPAVVRLSDGRVLVAGGHNDPGETTSAQVFDPLTTSWTTVGSLIRARNFPTTMIVDENGDGADETAMIFGGYNTSYGTQNTAERYDVAAHTFAYLTYPQMTTTTTKQGGKLVTTTKVTNVQSNMVSARELYTATKLPNGKVLLVGGFKTFNWPGGGTQRTAEIYDPVTKRFAATGSMSASGTPYGRFGHDALLIPGTNKVLIVGGKERRSNTDWRSLRSIEIYDAATGVFSYVGDMTYRRDRVTLAWVEAAKRVLIVGGKSEAGALGEPTADVLPSEWFDPATNLVSEGPSLAQGRMGHTLTPLADGTFVVVGGWSERRGDGTPGTTAVAERFIPNGLGGFFTGAGSTLFDTHDHGAAPLSDGRVLIVGGKQVTDGATSTYPKRAELYTP